MAEPEIFNAEKTASLTQEQIDKVWGYIGDGRTGWKVCQFVREGRFALTQGEWDSVCNNRAGLTVGVFQRERWQCADHYPIPHGMGVCRVWCRSLLLRQEECLRRFR